MGTFFSNCQVQSDSQVAVADALTMLLKEPAYVSPSVGGWVGVYPEGTRTDLAKLAKQLSKQLSCGVFTWNVHDDDIFYYTLFEDGKRRDEFNSSPDYFNPVSKGEMKRLHGKPEVLVPFCLPGVSTSQVQEVLHPPSRVESELAAEASAPPPHDIKAITQWLTEQQKIGNYQAASVQAGGLAELLGMDWQLSSLDYKHNQRGNLDSYLDQKFVFIDAAMLSAKNLKKKLHELGMQAEDIRQAIEDGADPNEKCDLGEPILVAAAFRGAAEVVQILLSAGADINVGTTKKSEWGWEELGVTPLVASVQGGANVEMGGEAAESAPQIETVQILLDAGADINAKTETGRTALSEAQENWQRFSNRKSDRWYSEEVLAECVARNATLVEMLRAAGATNESALWKSAGK